MIPKIFKLLFQAFLFMPHSKIMAKTKFSDQAYSFDTPWQESKTFENESKTNVNDIMAEIYPWPNDFEKDNLYLNLLQKLNDNKVVNNGYTIEEQKQMVNNFEEIYQFQYHPSQHMFEKLNLIVHLATVKSENENNYVFLSALAVRSLFVATYIEICKEYRNILPTIKLTAYDKPTNLLISYRQDHYYSDGDAFLTEMINKMRESIEKNGIPIEEFNHEAQTKLEDNINSSSNAIDIELLKNFYLYSKSFVFQNQYALDIITIEEILLKYSNNKIKIPSEVIFWLNLIEVQVRRESHFLLNQPPYHDMLSDEEFATAIDVNQLQANQLINMVYDDTIDSIKMPFVRYIGNKIATDFMDRYRKFTPWQLFEIYNDLLAANPKYISNINNTVIIALNILNKDHVLSDKNLTQKHINQNDLTSLIYQEVSKIIIRKLQKPIDLYLYQINILKSSFMSLLLMSLFIRYSRNYFSFFQVKSSQPRFIVSKKPQITTARAANSKPAVKKEQVNSDIPVTPIIAPSTPMPNKWLAFEEAITIDASGVSKEELRSYKNVVRYFKESVSSQQNIAWLNDSLSQNVNLFINELKTKLPETSPILVQLNAKLQALRADKCATLDPTLDRQIDNEDEEPLIPDFDQIIGPTSHAEPPENHESDTLAIINPSASTLNPVLGYFSFCANPRFAKFASDASTYLKMGYADIENKYTQTINRAFKFLIIQFFSSIEPIKLEKSSASAFTSVRDGICHEWNTIENHPQLNIYLSHILNLITETKHGTLDTLNDLKRQLDLYEAHIISLSRSRQNLSIPVNIAINILLKLIKELNTIEKHRCFNKDLSMLAAADICAQIGETLKYATPRIAELAPVTQRLITLRCHAYHNQMTADRVVDVACADIKRIKEHLQI